MNLRKPIVAAIALAAAAAVHATPVVTATTDANTLANAIGGSGITISGATFTSDGAQAGTFTGGASSVGFDAGIVLTTGGVSCIAGPNSASGCTGGPSGASQSSLKFNFTSDTGKVFFKYVFASEEYNEYVGSSFNDTFQLLLSDGTTTTNIAKLPSTTTGTDIVQINNVNCSTNSAYYINNSSGVPCTNANLDIQYDGLTVVLTATADLIAGKTYSFEFKIADLGDTILDSGVFVQAGSFSGTNNGVPEPASLALVGLGLLGAGAARRRRA